MAANKPYVGDVGTEIVLDVGEDISGASAYLKVQKPDGSSAVWDANVYAISGVSRYVRHTIVAGDFNVPGFYKIQPHVSLSGDAWSGLGETVEIKVHGEYQ